MRTFIRICFINVVKIATKAQSHQGAPRNMRLKIIQQYGLLIVFCSNASDTQARRGGQVVHYNNPLNHVI